MKNKKLPWVYCAIIRSLYGYFPSIIISIIFYSIHWKYQTATSHDSFTGFALFYVAPMYFAMVVIGNAWVLFEEGIRVKRRHKVQVYKIQICDL